MNHRDRGFKREICREIGSICVLRLTEVKYKKTLLCHRCFLIEEKGWIIDGLLAHVKWIKKSFYVMVNWKYLVSLFFQS